MPETIRSSYITQTRCHFVSKVQIIMQMSNFWNHHQRDIWDNSRFFQEFLWMLEYSCQASYAITAKAFLHFQPFLSYLL